MINLFIPYNLAVMAKEKGFNEPCLAYWVNETPTNKEGQLLVYYKKPYDNIKITTSIIKEYCYAPLYQQIVDWLRNEHSVQIKVERAVSGHFSYGLHNRNMINYGPYTQPNLVNKSEYFIATYYEALNKAIDEAFKLIP